MGIQTRRAVFVLAVASLESVASAGPPNIAGLSTQFGCSFASIKDAIVAAPTGATIYVTPGTYTETWGLIASKDLRIEPAANATCHSAGTGRVTVDAGSAARLATISSGSLVLRNVDVVGGSVSGALGGGQLRLVSSDLVLDDATLTGGDAGTGSGGAVRVGVGSTMTMLDGSVVADNAATTGGGVAVEAGGSLTMASGARIERNSATGDGGGVYVDSGTLTVQAGATIASNVGSVGGGGGGVSAVGATVEIAGSVDYNAVTGILASGGTLTLLPGAEVVGNIGLDGAGIACLGCDLTATSATIADNVALDDGGGVYADGMAVVSLTDTTLSRNAGMSGAGLFTGASTTVITSTISDNTSDRDGGGIYCLWCDLVVVGSTLVGNEATTGVGGAIGSSAPWARATVDLTDTLVDGNAAGGIWAGGGLYLSDTDAVLDNVDVLGNANWGVAVLDASRMTACNGTSWGSGADDNWPSDVAVNLSTWYSFPGVRSMVCDATLGLCDLTPVACVH